MLSCALRFNHRIHIPSHLKLPMKKRYQEVMLCLENLAVMLAEKELEFDIQAKHLYHDREEITVHIALK